MLTPDEAMHRPRVPLTTAEAAEALEEAWRRRREELAGWQPSNGWLIPSAVKVKDNERG